MSRGCACGLSAFEELATSLEKEELDYSEYDDREIDPLKFSEEQLQKDLQWIKEQKKNLAKPLRLPKDGLTQKERKKLLDFEEERIRYLLEDPERLKKDTAIHMGIEAYQRKETAVL